MSSNTTKTPPVDYGTSFTYPSTEPNTTRKQILQFSGSDEELFEKIKELKKEGVVSICIRYIYNNKSHAQIEYDMPKNKSNSSSTIRIDNQGVRTILSAPPKKGGKQTKKAKHTRSRKLKK